MRKGKIMSVEIMQFDRDNTQDNYNYMAKSIENDKYVVGYIVIDKPWYSSEKDWTYYIVNNEYGSGYCGGAINLGLKGTIVERNTIEPYTQTAHIKYNQAIGIDTKLIHEFDFINPDNEKQIIYIKPDDEIPYELWC